jgi:hypothetical protein
MSEKFISIVGLRHYFGSEIFRVGQMLILKKDHDNTHDDEAIAAHIEAVGKVGYVANSTYMVARGTRSAGRIYDSFEEEIAGEVCFVVKDCVIVKIVVE